MANDKSDVDTQKKLEELEELLRQSLKKEKPVSLSLSATWTKYIPIVVLSAGLVVSWTTQRNSLAESKRVLEKLEKKVERQEIVIQDVKLKGVKESADVKHIKEKVDKMDKKLDEILENNNQ